METKPVPVRIGVAGRGVVATNAKQLLVRFVLIGEVDDVLVLASANKEPRTWEQGREVDIGVIRSRGLEDF